MQLRKIYAPSNERLTHAPFCITILFESTYYLQK